MQDIFITIITQLKLVVQKVLVLVMLKQYKNLKITVLQDGLLNMHLKFIIHYKSTDYEKKSVSSTSYSYVISRSYCLAFLKCNLFFKRTCTMLSFVSDNQNFYFYSICHNIKSTHENNNYYINHNCRFRIN
jgi:hypothetical protein